MVKAGRLGRKAGAGFFSYDAGDDGAPDQHVVDPARGEDPGPLDRRTGRSTAADRWLFGLILPMLLEATRILEEEKVGDVRDIDLAVLFGLGFPASKGGLLWWADTLGAARDHQANRIAGR